MEHAWEKSSRHSTFPSVLMGRGAIALIERSQCYHWLIFHVTNIARFQAYPKPRYIAYLNTAQAIRPFIPTPCPSSPDINWRRPFLRRSRRRRRASDHRPGRLAIELLVELGAGSVHTLAPFFLAAAQLRTYVLQRSCQVSLTSCGSDLDSGPPRSRIRCRPRSQGCSKARPQ